MAARRSLLLAGVALTTSLAGCVNSSTRARSNAMDDSEPMQDWEPKKTPLVASSLGDPNSNTSHEIIVWNTGSADQTKSLEIRDLLRGTSILSETFDFSARSHIKITLFDKNEYELAFIGEASAEQVVPIMSDWFADDCWATTIKFDEDVIGVRSMIDSKCI